MVPDSGLDPLSHQLINIVMGTRPLQLLFFFFFFGAGKLEKDAMLNDDFSISRLAIPASSVLINFLAYTSQYFFLHFESVPLRKDEVWKLNIVTLCVWVCYFRSCYIDPGRLPPRRKAMGPNPQEKVQPGGRQRWCRRCEAYKPPRAHHCKTCKRLILPWLKI